eukprot:3482245-Prymnesium_polylepis.1
MAPPLAEYGTAHHVGARLPTMAPSTCRICHRPPAEYATVHLPNMAPSTCLIWHRPPACLNMVPPTAYCIAPGVARRLPARREAALPAARRHAAAALRDDAPRRVCLRRRPGGPGARVVARQPA